MPAPVPQDPHSSPRIGDAERAAAVDALDAHRAAGRLTPVEYEDREVAVNRAVTWDDVRPAFEDLPEPHPAGMPPTGLPSAQQAISVPDQGPAGVIGRFLPAPARNTVMALVPFAALVLFFRTGSWMWFLAIPVMGILLFGPEDRDARRERRRGSDR